MKTNNFRDDLSNIPAKTATLIFKRWTKDMHKRVDSVLNNCVTSTADGPLWTQCTMRYYAFAMVNRVTPPPETTLPYDQNTFAQERFRSVFLSKIQKRRTQTEDVLGFSTARCVSHHKDSGFRLRYRYMALNHDNRLKI